MAEVLELYRAGQAVPDPEPGDLFLTHDHYWAARVIRLGQRLRYHGPVRQYAYFNHAGAFVTPTGDIVEAMGQGVVRRHISRYQAREYVVVRIQADPHDRAQMARFYEHQAEARSRYGRLTLVSIALSLLTGAKLVFAMNGSDICSGLCAAGLTRGNYILDQSPVHTMPADLAKMFDVPGPSDFWQL